MPPELPLRVRILKRIQEQMSADIIAGSTYFHTLANRVYVGRTRFDLNDEVPFVTIMEVPVAPEQMQQERGAASTAGKWELIVQGFAQESEDRACRFLTERAYMLEQDVRCWLLANLVKSQMDSSPGPSSVFGFREIHRIEVVRGIVRPDEEQSTVSTFYIPLTIFLGGA